MNLCGAVPSAGWLEAWRGRCTTADLQRWCVTIPEYLASGLPVLLGLGWAAVTFWLLSPGAPRGTPHATLWALVASYVLLGAWVWGLIASLSDRIVDAGFTAVVRRLHLDGPWLHRLLMNPSGLPFPPAYEAALARLQEAVRPSTVTAWSLMQWQQMAEAQGDRWSVVDLFWDKLSAPAPGQPVPGLVQFALRSPHREERERAIRWMGEAS